MDMRFMMDENKIMYSVLLVAVSVIVNILLIQMKKLLDKYTDRRRRHNQITGSHRNRTSYPSIPNRNTSDDSGQKLKRVKPPLPNRKMSSPIRTPDTFPKCPRCGAKNRRGNLNLVTWDVTKNRWKCHNGHCFAS